ncbi:hypothetical protein LF599_15035 [Pseudodesulfovibrio thermohalotolerans]|uniref:hypothetical protein n=1 Tax=Pseudodesulfovibrio thermohalotolerans TaxID=2880651 RepID=UPI0024429F9B|nr:hypothetical protein [Pseudodesulfovibrio thermohalotolerans]WFS61965.1 hypothetical protein LF599_15035 [Pseudodesulfovibrio thermohalotolerans]
MYLKRYLFALALYYPPYVLLQQWTQSLGAPSNAAHALTQTAAALLYVFMSLYLTILKPQKRFAFEAAPTRITRWLMYLLLYAGLVFLPALLLLHSDSPAFHITLAIPALLFLMMLYSPDEEWDDGETEDAPPPSPEAYPGAPITRGMFFALAYFTIFTALAVVLRKPLAQSGVPNSALPVMISMIMTVIYLPMTLYLTVIRPARFLDFDRLSRRWLRFFNFVGLFALLAVLGPFILAREGSDGAWLAGILAPTLFIFMVQPIMAKVKLAAVPKTADSRWRSFKYSMAYTLILSLTIGGIAAYWVLTDKGVPASDELIVPATAGTGLLFLIFSAMLHRLIVTKPHSRFQAMSTRRRYRRWSAYILSVLLLQVVCPTAINVFWQVSSEPTHLSLVSIALLHCAAYGTDAAFARKGGSTPAAPRKEAPGEAIQRRLNALSRARSAAT